MPVIAAGLVPIILFTLIVLGTGTQWVAWTSPQLWETHSGDVATKSGATAVAVDNASLYVAGYLNLTTIPSYTVGEAGLEGRGFLARYDLGGHPIWTSTFGINFNYSAYPAGLFPSPVAGLAAGSGGVYLAGNYNATSLIAKYDEAGQRVWASPVGGLYSDIYAISATSTGINVIGSFSGQAETFREYDSNGNLLWNQSSSLINISAGPSGVYGLTASNFVKYNSNGNAIWTRPGGCQSNTCALGQGIASDGAAIYVLESDGSVQKYAPDGSILWNARFTLPRSGDIVGYASISAGVSGIYLFVRPIYETGIFFVKLDSTGAIVWSRQATQSVYGWKWPIPYLSAGMDGLYVTGTDGRVIMENFAASPSLIYLGFNPPWSFVALGATVAPIASILTFTIRRARRSSRKRPKAVRPSGISGLPPD